ncbi:hypothetical protein [Mesomycoplasma ovipneumoniae]|uniref:hypothetical protein n=1 Tax=Mesomycoplasma ovipneumoniae TaxID=29562 RepID=UPI0029651DC4|nr:hypothetical protein [Mesomycoplasma ovipneumoniae]MDW2920395.1 hypothetical protein [Mesomycoplasma ovipneumoniae]MDW2929241.1 hypothetical protein [Mesomycoplasma ovipneumoniae]
MKVKKVSILISDAFKKRCVKNETIQISVEDKFKYIKITEFKVLKIAILPF